MTLNRPPRTLYRGGRVRTPVSPFATALLVDGDTVAWVGGDDLAASLDADTVVDLDDALLAPAFVDAHVHTTATGLALGGLDVTGARTLGEALDAVARHARAHPGEVLLGTGWDETAWPEGRPPTAAELDRAAAGAPVYLARADVHAAVASPALLERALPGGEDLWTGRDGWAGDGLCRREAHHLVRAAAYASIQPGQRTAAQRLALAAAAARGVAAVHEMAGPEVSSLEDLTGLLDLAGTEDTPHVVAYWSGDVETAARLGIGFGGDLFVDGSLGSHTAALTSPYTDSPSTRGTLSVDAEEIAGLLVACDATGTQAGFHAIGDAAISAVLDGFERAAGRLGPHRVTRARHRLEHAEMAGPADVTRMARLGVVASVQPAFDARWGGPDGMYARRLGGERAASMNPLAAMAAAGVVLALSSDAPVTPLDPWGGVRSAVGHHQPRHALTARAAFSAATRGGWRAARADGDGSGELAPGSPATFAVWRVNGELVVQVPDERISAWSTDPRSAVAGLPDLNGPDPVCVRTVVEGRTIYANDGAQHNAHAIN